MKMCRYISEAFFFPDQINFLIKFSFDKNMSPISLFTRSSENMSELIYLINTKNGVMI